MSVKSGKGGNVYVGGLPIANVKTWSVRWATEEKAYNDSSTAGQTNRVPANSDCSGSFTFHAGTAGSTLAPGQFVQVTLGTVLGNQHSGPALLGEFSSADQIESGDPIEVTVTFSQGTSDGSSAAWTHPTGQ